MQIAFSGIVVCYNEGHLLRRCLQSLDFCQELIIVDLGSTDDSVEIAKEFSARILTHKKVEYPNLARQYGITQAKNEWTVSIDPDEIFPSSELTKIKMKILEDRNLIGIRIPWQFYFRGKELSYTVWGRPNATKCAVIHRDRIQGTPFVHEEFSDSPDIFRFSRSSIIPIKHYWVNSYGELFEKHRRYVKNEGEKMYVRDIRFSWPKVVMATIQSLKTNLISYSGWRGGLTGISLSLFHSAYTFMSWLSLRRYEKIRGNHSSNYHE